MVAEDLGLAAEAVGMTRLDTDAVPFETGAGAGTSVGANYCEANESCSKRDFLYSISRCSKEAHETKHFLRMIVRAVPELKPQARTLWLEAKELHLIFSKIWRNK